MAGEQKPLVFNDSTGGFDEITPKTISAGAADAGKMFVPGPDGRWDETLLPNTDGARLVAVSESLSAGDFVNLYDDGGTPKLRKADASSLATRAHGFVKSAANEGDSVKFYESGPSGGFADLDVGEPYFLSDATAGEPTAVAPTTSGHIAQVVGVALSDTELQVDISEQPVVRA